MTAGTSKINFVNKRLRDISSPALTALIAINVVVLIVLAASSLTSEVNVAGALCLKPSFAGLQQQPWTLITYAFTQANVLQLLFNMLWLFSFGRLLMMICSDKDIALIYVCGAVAGGVSFLIFSSAFGPNAYGWLTGSSAAIIAVAVAVAVLMPDRELNLPLFGLVKIKWIVTVVVVIFFIGLSAPNAGGNLAHIGGAAAGAGYALIIRHRGKSGSSVGEYDSLVEKIKRSGYETLSQREKRRFFELSSQSRSK